jgi:hypothetical protein
MIKILNMIIIIITQTVAIINIITIIQVNYCFLTCKLNSSRTDYMLARAHRKKGKKKREKKKKKYKIRQFK